MSHFRKMEIVGLAEKPKINLFVDIWGPEHPSGASIDPIPFHSTALHSIDSILFHCTALHSIDSMGAWALLNEFFTSFPGFPPLAGRFGCAKMGRGIQK